MKAAKLLLLAYRSYKKGLTPIAEKIFAEAMNDETAPDLMEKLYALEAENVKEPDTDEKPRDVEININDDDTGVDNVEDTTENEENEDAKNIKPEDETLEEVISEDENLNDVLSDTQVAQLKAIANLIASKNASDLANKILAMIKKK